MQTIVTDEPLRQDEAIPKEISDRLTPEIKAAIAAMQRMARARRILQEPVKQPETRYIRLP